MLKRTSVALALAIGLTVLSAVPALASTRHTVAQGDTLWLISQWYGTTVAAIQQANGISGSMIHPGQVLTVPGGSSGQRHTVVRGDTLWLIAQRYGTTVAAIQQANGISGTMIYPGQTLSIPGGSGLGGSTGQRVNLQAWEMDLLARIISSEARGEPYSGQVAVGAVVINRMFSPIFPNTLYGVVYEVSHGFYQFSPVLDGSINLPATASARAAARDAVNGSDPSYGALYFFNWRTVSNAFLWARPHTVTIGNHRFAR